MSLPAKLSPPRERLTFKGQDLRKYKEHEIARLGIGRKFQNPQGLPQPDPTGKPGTLLQPEQKRLFYPVQENLQCRKAHRWGIAGNHWAGSQKPTCPRPCFPTEKSSGLEIGMLVAQSPDLLLVDEPVAGTDRRRNGADRQTA